MGGLDAVAVVEASYAPAATPRRWLEHSLEALRPGLDPDGLGCSAFRMQLTAPVDLEAVIDDSVSFEAPSLIRRMFAIFRRARPGWPNRDREGYDMHGAEVLSTLMTPQQMAAVRAEFDVAEAPFVNVPDGEGGVANFGFITRRPTVLSSGERAIYRRLTAHLAAGLRLAMQPEDALAAPDAVVDERGRVTHAEGTLKAPSHRERLLEEVKRVDRARRHAQRADPLKALSLWQGLVSGTWSLVERFDSDGRRFMVAVRNDPNRALCAEPLTRRQRQVLFYAAAGLGIQETAYFLGLHRSSVQGHLRAGLRRLGLRSRSELIGFVGRLERAAASEVNARAREG
ncbi:MAG: helix-turn-helix transcriptional regulator [Polyangiaceae bacterium]